MMTGCAMLDSTEIPNAEIEQVTNVLDLELIEHKDTKPFDYPTDLESRVKNSKTVRVIERDGTVYFEEVFVGKAEDNVSGLPPATESDTLYTLIDTPTLYKIRDVYQAGAENAKLVSQLNNVQELSVEERNQLLRVLRLEAYRAKRIEEFSKYYREELQRQQKVNAVDSFTWRVITALALAVAI